MNWQDMAVTIRRAKTETLSLRLDPKTKFMLDFMSRVQGQSITTVVERAVQKVAAGVSFADYNSADRTWATFWDASEGVRTLNLIGDADYPTNFEEDELLSFAKTHWPFFYTSERATSPRRAFVDVLWPKVDVYLNLWREKRQTNYWAAGEAMRVDLEAARIAAPEWPAKATTEPTTIELNDEIPF
jgi:hypothetical protein